MSLKQSQQSKKRKILRLTRLTIWICVIVVLIHVIHALTLDRMIQYVEVDFQTPAVPVEMNGYRIAFITDTHELEEDDATLWEIVEVLNDQEIDLLLFGGDFSARPGAPNTLGILSHIETVDGAFGVRGNHDVFWDLSASMEAYEIKLLSNEGLHIRDNFFLAGVEVFHPNIVLATGYANSDDFILLLSHQPDVSMRQDTHDVDLILSGHIHGGQITFFGIWAPYLTLTNHITAYGQRFRSGWATSRDGTPVFVSNGVGDYLPRIFARPQIIIMTLYNEEVD